MARARAGSKPRQTLRLLGSPQIIEGENAQPIFDRASQIIGLLALAPGHFLRRAHVAEVVWGDHQTGLINLRQALARLRRNPSPLARLVEADATSLRLCPDGVDIDVLGVLMGAQNRVVSDEVDIPLGDFLQGVDTPSLAFEDWLRDARGQLEEARRVLAAAALEQATRYGLCDSARFHALSGQLRAFDGGSASIEAMITAAERRLGRDTHAQPAIEEDTKPPRTPPRVALLRPVADAPKTLPLERFIGDVADRLSCFRTFATIAPYSSFAIAAGDLAAAAQRLNIAYAIETRLFRKDGIPVLAVRLIAAGDARIVWASEFTLTPDTLPERGKLLSRTIAATLADRVEADLAQQERAASEPGAYLHFLAGRAQQLRGDLPALRRARNSFRAALRSDAGFAVAGARIAETLVIEWILRGGTDGELLASAHGLARQARSSDPGAAEAHWILGSTDLYRRDYDRVEEHFETAQALAPHSADLLLNFADAMSHLDAPARAEVLFQQALDLNPTPPDRYWWFGASIALSCGNFTVAAERCDRIDAEEVAVGMRTTCFALDGQHVKAADWARRLREVLPEMSVAELASLMPGLADNALQRNYREGLYIAGLK